MVGISKRQDFSALLNIDYHRDVATLEGHGIVGQGEGIEPTEEGHERGVPVDGYLVGGIRLLVVDV